MKSLVGLLGLAVFVLYMVGSFQSLPKEHQAAKANRAQLQQLLSALK